MIVSWKPCCARLLYDRIVKLLGLTFKRHHKLSPTCQGCGLILRIALGRDPGSSHLPKQVRHVGPGLWTPALRADTTSSIAWALSMFPSTAGNGCPKQVFGLLVTIHHCRTSEEMDSDQHICQDRFLSPARNLAIKL